LNASNWQVSMPETGRPTTAQAQANLHAVLQLLAAGTAMVYPALLAVGDVAHTTWRTRASASTASGATAASPRRLSTGALAHRGGARRCSSPATRTPDDVAAPREWRPS